MTPFQERSLVVACLAFLLCSVFSFINATIAYHEYANGRLDWAILRSIGALVGLGGVIAMYKMIKYIDKRAKEYEISMKSVREGT